MGVPYQYRGRRVWSMRGCLCHLVHLGGRDRHPSCICSSSTHVGTWLSWHRLSLQGMPAAAHDSPRPP